MPRELTPDRIRRALAQDPPPAVRPRMQRRDLAGRILPRAEGPPPDIRAQQAAVLVLLYERGREVCVPFTRRAAGLAHHAGQISFPGGAVEPADASPLAAALREAREEIGLPDEWVEPWGELAPLYVRPSNYMVHPFVAYLDRAPTFRPARDEVAEVFEVPLAELLLPSRFTTALRVVDGVEFWMPEFLHGGHRIWGATALILDQLLARIEAADGEGVAS